MKKLFLCLLVAFCFFGCSLNSQVSGTVKNNTEKTQTISVFSEATNELVYTFEIAPFGQQSFTLDSWYDIVLNTKASFNEKFVCSFEKNNTWSINNAAKTTYTIQSELDFDITLANFNIVNGQKSNPRYSVFIPNNSKINTATIEVYPDWLGGIWDLAERNITSIYDYNDKMFQFVVIGDKTYYYEIVISGSNIYIRNR